MYQHENLSLLFIKMRVHVHGFRAVQPINAANEFRKRYFIKSHVSLRWLRINSFIVTSLCFTYLNLERLSNHSTNKYSLFKYYFLLNCTNGGLCCQPDLTNKEYTDYEFVDHTKYWPMWVLNPQFSAQCTILHSRSNNSNRRIFTNIFFF